MNNRMGKKKSKKLKMSDRQQTPASGIGSPTASQATDTLHPEPTLQTLKSAETNLLPCNEDRGPEQQQRRWETIRAYLIDRVVSKIPLAVSGVSFAASIAAAIYTYKQADIADQSLYIGQRAFVHLENIEERIADNWVVDIEQGARVKVFNLPRNAGKMIHSKFSLTNSGNTPTKSLQIMLHCELVPPQSAQTLKDPFNLLKWDDAKVINRSIGSHQTIGVGNDTCDFKNRDVLLNAQMQIVPVFLTGQVKYQDWVRPKLLPLHQTEFAHRLIVHNPGQGEAFEGMDVTTEPVGSHNCTDEDCPP